MRESTLIVDSSQQLDYLKCPIFLKQSVEPTGRYGRTLGVVFVNGMNVNLEMVKTGLAEVYRGRPAKGFNPQAEPRPEVRGNIARIYFYMNWAYPGHGILTKKNQKLFEAWDKEDPVDDWECERSKRIEGIQRNGNPFVKKICIKVGIW